MKFVNQASLVSQQRVLILILILILSALTFSAVLVQTQDTPQTQRPVWDVQMAANAHASSNITIRNLCKKSHSFTIIKQETPYLNLTSATATVPGHKNHDVPVRFSTDGMKPGPYQGNVVVKCDDCQKEKGCQQDRELLPLRLVVLGENTSGTPSMNEGKIPSAPTGSGNNPGPIAGGSPGATPTPLTPTDTASGEVCKWIAYKTYRVDEWKREQSTDKDLEVRHGSAKGGGVAVEFHCKAAGTFIFTVTKEDGSTDVVSVTCTQP